MNKIDKALDVFWIGYVLTSAIWIKAVFHATARDYYVWKLRSLRGQTRKEVEVSYRAMWHATCAQVALANNK